MRNLYNRMIVRSLISQYFGSKAKIEYAKESKGTVRFTVTDFEGSAMFYTQGYYRLRKNKTIEPSAFSGDSFNTIHFGKLSIGIEKDKGRSVWNFASSAPQE